MQGNHEISPTDDDNVQQTHHNPSEDTHVKTLRPWNFQRRQVLYCQQKINFELLSKESKNKGLDISEAFKISQYHLIPISSTTINEQMPKHLMESLYYPHILVKRIL